MKTKITRRVTRKSTRGFETALKIKRMPKVTSSTHGTAGKIQRGQRDRG